MKTIKTKKLAMALCLMLISAVLLATASFAWFSMNTEVDVDGIEVEAYSDALYLEISKSKEDSTFGTSTSFAATEKATLRLVTPFTLTSAVYVTPVACEGYYTSSLASTALYVKGDAKADTYSADNYIKIDNTTLATASDLTGSVALKFVISDDTAAVPGTQYYQKNAAKTGYTPRDFVVGEVFYVATPAVYYTFEQDAYTPVAGLLEGDSLDGLYDVTFVETEDLVAATGTEYYEEDDGVYTKVTVAAGEDTVGMFVIADSETLDADDKHPARYTLSGGDYILQTDLTHGSSLDGIYTLTTAPVTLTAANGDVYMLDGNDYVCVYKTTVAQDISSKVFWARAYSDTLGDGQEENTLSVMKPSTTLQGTYYRKETVYLRSAENTNPGTDLKIAEVSVGGRVNDLSDALRVYFVATNGAGETVTRTYDNGTKTMDSNNPIFASIGGDRSEIVQVDIYVYFDGTDPVAFTAAGTGAGILNGQTVSVKFTIAEPDYNK